MINSWHDGPVFDSIAARGHLISTSVDTEVKAMVEDAEQDESWRRLVSDDALLRARNGSSASSSPERGADQAQSSQMSCCIAGAAVVRRRARMFDVQTPAFRNQEELGRSLTSLRGCQSMPGTLTLRALELGV